MRGGQRTMIMVMDHAIRGIAPQLDERVGVRGVGSRPVI